VWDAGAWGQGCEGRDMCVWLLYGTGVCHCCTDTSALHLGLFESPTLTRHHKP